MKRYYPTLITLLLYTGTVNAQNNAGYFITQWNTTLDTTSDGTSIQFAGRGTNYTVLVSGLDTVYSGSMTANGLVNIPVPKPGSYTVIAYSGNGTFDGYSNYGGGSGTPQTDSRDMLTKIVQWGGAKFTRLNFNSADNLDITATDIPDLSNITDMQEAFAYCPSLKGNKTMEKWDVSNVVVMYKMFMGDAKFDRDLGKWNIKSGVNLSQMFAFTGMSRCNYTSTLSGWAANANTANKVFFGGQEQMQFTDSTDRNKLIAKQWVISGDAYTTNGCYAVVQPFAFTKPTAGVSNGQLTVNWSTISEHEADHFEIEASSDTLQFKQLGTVPSKAVDGHSETTLSYTFTTPYDHVLELIAAFGCFGLFAIPLSRKRRYAGVIPILLCVLCLTLSIGCKKSGSPGSAGSGKKIYIRIVGVDKSGEKSYSEIFSTR